MLCYSANGMEIMKLRFFPLLLIVFVVSCSGTAPIRHSAYPIDCRKEQPAKDLLQRGDVHRNQLLQETAPDDTEPEMWTQVRRLHGVRARTCYQLVLDEKPDHPDALLNIGFTHLVESTLPDQEQESRDKALITATNFIQQSLEARRLDAQAYFYLGEIAARRGRCDRALSIFNALIASRWDYSHVYAWIGYCEEQAGRPGEAKSAYEKAVEISNPVGIAEWARTKIK
jgi:tetratricopeptide (TPR) repeat protein